MRVPPNFYEFYLQKLNQILTVNIQKEKKKKLSFYKGEGKRNYFKMFQSSGKTILIEPNLLGFYQSLTDLREKKYPFPAGSSLPQGRREICNSSPL